MDQMNFVAKELGFQYQDIPGSFMEALKMNGNVFLHALLNDFHPLNEANVEDLTDYEFPESDLGGIIVFSTTVNAVVDDATKSKVIAKIKGIWETLKNRVQVNKKLNAVLFGHSEVQAVSIGNFFKGRYTAKNGTTYDETSLSVEIIGISFELLCTIASELAKSFKQETVLVKSNSKRILLIKAM